VCAALTQLISVSLSFRRPLASVAIPCQRRGASVPIVRHRRNFRAATSGLESMSAIPLKLLIVGDTRLYCDGVANLLRSDERCVVLCVAYTVAEALARLGSASPDTVLVDIGMTGGCEIISTITHNRPGIRVVALGVDENRDNIIRCAEAGAAGYVPRTASVEELVAILQSAHRGELRCSATVAGTLLKRVAVLAVMAGTSVVPGCRDLTQREREIADLIALRMSNKQIAGALGIGCATVKNHVHNILAKVHARHRYEIQSLPMQSYPAASRLTESPTI
jgi:two-component system nitrate/nitrite response regulator NarL